MSEVMEALEGKEVDEPAEAPEEETPQEDVKSAESEAEPETKPETEPEPEQPKNDFVPLAKHLSATNRLRQEHQNEVAALRAEMEKLKQPQEPKPEPPNPEEDPFGALSYQIAQAEAKVDSLGQQNQQTRQLLQQAEAQKQIVVMENSYKQQNPDYEDAINHVREQRFKLYEVMGIPEEQFDASFAAETQQFLQTALASGQDPFDAAFRMAEVQGFRPKARDAVKQTTQNKEKVEAAASLSSINGKKPEDAPEVDDINSMSDREFDKLFSGPDGDANWRRIAGG